jgi:hypothetical protein
VTPVLRHDQVASFERLLVGADLHHVTFFYGQDDNPRGQTTWTLSRSQFINDWLGSIEWAPGEEPKQGDTPPDPPPTRDAMQTFFDQLDSRWDARFRGIERQLTYLMEGGNDLGNAKAQWVMFKDDSTMHLEYFRNELTRVAKALKALEPQDVLATEQALADIQSRVVEMQDAMQDASLVREVDGKTLDATARNISALREEVQDILRTHEQTHATAEYHLAETRGNRTEQRNDFARVFARLTVLEEHLRSVLVATTDLDQTILDVLKPTEATRPRRCPLCGGMYQGREDDPCPFCDHADPSPPSNDGLHVMPTADRNSTQVDRWEPLEWASRDQSVGLDRIRVKATRNPQAEAVHWRIEDVDWGEKDTEFWLSQDDHHVLVAELEAWTERGSG